MKHHLFCNNLFSALFNQSVQFGQQHKSKANNYLILLNHFNPIWKDDWSLSKCPSVVLIVFILFWLVPSFISQIKLQTFFPSILKDTVSELLCVWFSTATFFSIPFSFSLHNFSFFSCSGISESNQMWDCFPVFCLGLQYWTS